MNSSIFTLSLAVFLPWLFGSLLARWLSGPGRPILLYLGQGYMLGTFAVVWLITGWDAGGWTLSFWPMAIVLLLFSVPLMAGVRRDAWPKRATPQNAKVLKSAGWQQGTMLLLCLTMGTHLLLVAQELMLRPTFPWDAWRGWDPKVIQFFVNRSLDAPMYTIGNYGEVSTNALLWMMLASETTHEPFLHLPWLFAYVALAAMVYGYLRERYSNLLATLGAYMVMSLPYLNSHVALAGYADIWVALAFTVGALALSDFRRNQRSRQLCLALLMAIACLQTKRAGMGFAAVLVALVVLEAGLRAPKPVGVTLTVVIGIILAALGSTLLGYMDLELPLPGSPTLLLSSEGFRVTGLLRFTFDPDWQPRPFYEALLQFGNWHLAAYLWLAAIVLVVRLRKWPLFLETNNVGILGGLAVITLYFVMVSPETALDHTGLSRALLYVMPLAVVWLLATWWQLIVRGRKNPREV